MAITQSKTVFLDVVNRQDYFFILLETCSELELKTCFFPILPWTAKPPAWRQLGLQSKETSLLSSKDAQAQWPSLFSGDKNASDNQKLSCSSPEVMRRDPPTTLSRKKTSNIFFLERNIF